MVVEVLAAGTQKFAFEFALFFMLFDNLLCEVDMQVVELTVEDVSVGLLF